MRTELRARIQAFAIDGDVEVADDPEENHGRKRCLPACVGSVVAYEPY
jgi:hypothetical protein